MDAGVMQDIDDVYSSTDAKTIETLFDNSADYVQQLSSISFWDNLDKSADSSFVNSATTSISHQTPNSSAADSPASISSLEPPTNSHKHKLSPKSTPKKRRCSDSKRSKFSQDPSPLDCSDYWLRFDSDNDSLDLFGERALQARTNVRSPGLVPLPTGEKAVGTPDNISKVALPPPGNDLIDDSALDHALSDEDDLFTMGLAEQLSKTDSGPIPSEVPPRERLYSTPLSWEQPQPGFRMDYMNVAPFSDPERQRLLAIAMGTGQVPAQSNSRPPAGMDFRFEINQSPTTMSDATSNTPEPTRPRNTTTRPQPPSRTHSENMIEKKDRPKNNDRAAHNDIERKYRTNLKEKISELRDAIPSLRSLPEEGEGDSPVNSSRTAPKVSKGTVLTKATEYIHQLERRNRSMAQKNEELARRLHAFEQLVGAAAPPPPPNPSWQPQGYGAAVFNPRAFT